MKRFISNLPKSTAAPLQVTLTEEKSSTLGELGIASQPCAVSRSRPRYRAQGLVVLFLLPYCSELNPIEGQWHQLKTHELAGRMFEYEDQSAGAIVDGMIDRSVLGDYDLHRLMAKAKNERYERINPDFFSRIACVKVYPDKRVEKDRGESCYDPDLPEAIVLKSKNRR